MRTGAGDNAVVARLRQVAAVLATAQRVHRRSPLGFFEVLSVSPAQSHVTRGRDTLPPMEESKRVEVAVPADKPDTFGEWVRARARAARYGGEH